MGWWFAVALGGVGAMSASAYAIGLMLASASTPTSVSTTNRVSHVVLLLLGTG